MKKPEPPTIMLHVHDDVQQSSLTPLLLGIEEEGVPVEVHRTSELNPLTLAHGAAISSRLGIGIGISLDYVVVTTEKLSAERPYIARNFSLDAAADRIVGSNAARIVKRIPLRNFRQERNQ